MERKLATLEQALTLIKASLEKTLDSKGLGALFVEGLSRVADAIGTRAQDALQAQTTLVDGLTEEIGHKRRLGRHRERE